MGRYKPRINLCLLTLPKTKGEIGLPEFKRYPSATHISRIIDWHCHERNKDWVTLETTNDIQNLTWTCNSKISTPLKKHPLIKITLDIFHKIDPTCKIASSPGPLTPIDNNPDFPPGVNQKRMPKPARSKTFLAVHCFHKGRLKSYDSMKEEFGESLPDEWFYIQLHDFLQNSQFKASYCLPMTPLEQICYKRTPVYKTTSLAYSWLTQKKHSDNNRHRESREQALKTKLTDAQLERLHFCS